MCTNFLLAVPAVPASSNSVQYLSARCMELTGTLASNLYRVPAQQQFPLFPNRSHSWTGTYGFVGIADPQAMPEFACFMDGINEVGLSCASLWLPGTQYATAHKGMHDALEFSDLGAWAMSQFSSVADLLQALPNIEIVGPASTAKTYLPLHFIITDSSGASVVIEFIGGATNVYPPDYDNGATGDGVLTNAPPYDWQRTNLANYAHLKVEGTGTSTSADAGPPVGSGLLGLPGDIMSASRFVKAATFRKGYHLLPSDGAGWLPTAPKAGAADSSQTIVNVAMQMVQMIQATPYGSALIEAKPPSIHPTLGDWTMWQVVRDHSNFAYYFSSAFNSSLQMVDLTTVDFGGGSVKPEAFKSIRIMPGSSSWYTDVSSGFA